MNSFSYDFLAGTGFADNQNRGIGFCSTLKNREYILIFGSCRSPPNRRKSDGENNGSAFWGARI